MQRILPRRAAHPWRSAGEWPVRPAMATSGTRTKADTARDTARRQAGDMAWRMARLIRAAIGRGKACGMACTGPLSLQAGER
jgi:hypothetical protein